MKKSKKSAGPKVDPYLEGLMGKLLDHLVVLEKKVDSLIARSGGQSAPLNQNASKPQHVQAPKPPQQQPQQPPRRERTLYEAVCADCSKICEVPFRPVEGRAVYCKECFAKRKGQPHGMPVLTPVAIPPKPMSKLGAPSPAPAEPAKKSKKVPAAKPKAKKKK